MHRQNFEDPSLTLDTLMSVWPETIAVFLHHRMVCVGCMVTPFHTVTDACLEYELDEQVFRAELWRAISS